MPKRTSSNEATSARVASVASKLLSNPHSSKAVRTVAASVLTQRPGSSKKR